MILQRQLGDPHQLLIPEPLLFVPRPLDFGLLGNQLAQNPSFEGVATNLVDSYYKLRSAPQPALRLALIKQRKFTLVGRDSRIAASLAALNARQPTELSLSEWKQILEEVQDDEA